MNDRLTGATTELLQTMIRNACVNDGSAASGFEERSSDTLHAFLGATGLDVEVYDAAPGRRSLVARIEGSDPNAPSLCLMGHTDVVPVDERQWTRDPFGGEIVTNADGNAEVWGRGAVDMLNLTASMAVSFRELADTGFRPRGDLIFFAVADEESGSAYGARWMAEHHADAIRADYVLTENGGLHGGTPDAPTIDVNVGEKGVAWRRIRVHGRPGHGSMPYRSDNALVTTAAIVQRLVEYRPDPKFHELWRTTVDHLAIPPELRTMLLDEAQVDEALAMIPHAGAAGHLHAQTHTTFSCNAVHGPMKTNTIPGAIDLEVDVRTLPGENGDDVTEHLRAALGDLYDHVDVEIILNDPATISPTNTPLWDSVERAVNRPFPGARLAPHMVVGFTDARVYRQLGAIAYGAGLLSPAVDAGAFSQRFHGNDERIDVESLRLTTHFWLDVARDLLS